MITVASAIQADKVWRLKKYKVTPTQQEQLAIKAPLTYGIAIAAENSAPCMSKPEDLA